MTPAPHPLRCETCEHRYDHIKVKKGCPYDHEEVYYILREEMRLPRGAWLFTSVVGCTSHSAAQRDGDVLDDFVDWCKDAISSLEEKQCDGSDDSKML